jgi:hypothetical protein
MNTSGKTWPARPGAFFLEQDITHGYELATKSISGERIRTEQPNMQAGLLERKSFP